MGKGGGGGYGGALTLTETNGCVFCCESDCVIETLNRTLSESETHGNHCRNTTST